MHWTSNARFLSQACALFDFEMLYIAVDGGMHP